MYQDLRINTQTDRVQKQTVHVLEYKVLYHGQLAKYPSYGLPR